jgi:phospho-N-acetylmuramoyl-pentapeptide-transferase
MHPLYYLILAVLAAFAICLVIGPLLIPALKRLKFGQNIREDGPQSHMSKAGTPTMGGIILVLAIAASTFAFSTGSYQYPLFTILIMLGYAIIGFLDDIIKVVKKRNLGLKPYQKIIGQLGLAIVIALYGYFYIGTELIVPFANINWDIGIWFIPLTIFVAVATTNSVNLTDGLDGLASGVTMIISAALAIIIYYFYTIANAAGQTLDAVNLQNMMVCAGALAGACLGFLRFNAFPARIFMGDTGSLALGGILTAIMVTTRLQLMLPIMGIMIVVNTVSALLQRYYYKITKKRLFKMAPLHHHFELKGAHETKVVSAYMIITAAACLLALLTIRLPT